MKTRTLFVLVMIAGMALCLSAIQPAFAASDEDEILNVGNNFAKCFNDMDFNLMSTLWWHSSEASEFAPGMDGSFLYQGWDSIEKSWKAAFGLPKGTYNVTAHNLEVTKISDNVAILTSYATTTTNPPAVKEQSVSQNRGTFVLKKIEGKWLIVHIHVSALPTE